jgi:hypothetical protein
VQVLGNYSHINAFMDPKHVCAVVERAMQLSLPRRRQLGQAARAAFIADHAAFVRKVAFFAEFLKQQRQLH